MLYATCLVLYAICCTLYAIFYVLYAYMLYAACCVLYATCYMLHAICYMLYAVCFMLHAICYMPYAICHVPYAFCYMLHASCYMLTSASNPLYTLFYAERGKGALLCLHLHPPRYKEMDGGGGGDGRGAMYSMQRLADVSIMQYTGVEDTGYVLHLVTPRSTLPHRKKWILTFRSTPPPP